MERPLIPNGEDPSERRRRPCIAITLGDPNGVGPEVVLKCLADSRLAKFMDPIVVGSAHVLDVHAQKLGYPDVRIQPVQHVPDETTPGVITVLDVTGGQKPDVVFGEISKEGGLLAMQAVERATDLCLEGRADAMVTAPVNKESWQMSGSEDLGHQEVFKRLTGSKYVATMLVSSSPYHRNATRNIPR